MLLIPEKNEDRQMIGLFVKFDHGTPWSRTSE